MAEWDDESVAREPRKLWHDAMLLVAVLILLGSFLFTETPLPPVNRPVVDDIAPLPPKAERQRYADYIYAATYMIPKMRRPTVINLAKTMASGGTEPDNFSEGPIRLGYSVREIDFFSLPLFGYPEAGYVLYFDNWGGDQTYLYAAPLGPEGLELLRKETGDANVGSGWFFPFWRHMWGWIPLLLGAGWGWLQIRRIQRRRALLGII